MWVILLLEIFRLRVVSVPKNNVKLPKMFVEVTNFYFFNDFHNVTSCHTMRAVHVFIRSNTNIFQSHVQHSLSNVSSVSLKKKHTLSVQIDTTVLFFRIPQNIVDPRS